MDKSLSRTNSPALILPSSRVAATNAQAVTNELRDIKPPVAIPDAWLWLWWTLGLLVVLAISYWVWRDWRKKRMQQPTVAQSIPPHDRARQRLRDALALIDQPGPFCVAVSDTIRTYLEERFELRAPERTTEEFLGELQDSFVLTGAQKETLADFLTRCDLVKFARYEPVQSELEALHRSAERLVNETEPPPPLAPGAHASVALSPSR